MIAWWLAERVAGTVATVGEGDSSLALPGDITELGELARAAVVGYSELVPRAPIPPPVVVGRDEWARANVALLRQTIEPLTGQLDERLGQLPGPARAIAGAAMATEVGGLMGYMSRRVLGQYELVMSPGELEQPPRLLLVAPNLRQLAERMQAPLADLLAWVTVHELTHAVQFSSVPWLRPYLGGLVSELLLAADVKFDARALRAPTLDDARALWERARDGGIVTLVAGPERRELLDRIQSTMALVEGHAEHVMDAAGEALVPTLPQLRAALDQRRVTRSPLAAVIERLLGLELKMRQYRDGKMFCDAVVEQAGVAGLNRAFEGPGMLPSKDEIREPRRWVSRVA